VSTLAFRGNTLARYMKDKSDVHAGLAKGPAGFDIANRRARIYGTGNNILCWTSVPTMGVAVINMLRNPEAVLNRTIFICPFENLTQNVLLSALETVLGEKFDVENIDIAKINKHSRIALARGEGTKAMKGLTISNQFYEDDCGNDFRHLVENKLVGVEMMSVEDAVRDVIERYGKHPEIVEAMFNVQPCEI
jgi:nucleoside-diphosphate-sugar epimerase